ncbi:MAG: 23S rRNA (pseudouridine(1915)-N(3))-methyltransferase RlmH [Desulfovibrionaceae bacterium]|nr:23S rRNA (pseudouridine(1915)-N(3))-methyltransferase RlmH [Desulfovibrionaceae bacterium]
MIAKPIRLVCVGRVKTAWWKDACAEYAKRLSRFRKLEVVEVKDAESASDMRRRIETEGKRILEALEKSDRVVVLDERGRDCTSQELAKKIDSWDGLGQGSIAFVIGGPFGLSDEVRQRAFFLLRLSAMTMPHELARVVLMEQLYRAESIRSNVPYHH